MRILLSTLIVIISFLSCSKDEQPENNTIYEKCKSISTVITSFDDSDDMLNANIDTELAYSSKLLNSLETIITIPSDKDFLMANSIDAEYNEGNIIGLNFVRKIEGSQPLNEVIYEYKYNEEGQLTNITKQSKSFMKLQYNNGILQEVSVDDINYTIYWSDSNITKIIGNNLVTGKHIISLNYTYDNSKNLFKEDPILSNFDYNICLMMGVHREQGDSFVEHFSKNNILSKRVDYHEYSNENETVESDYKYTYDESGNIIVFENEYLKIRKDDNGIQTYIGHYKSIGNVSYN